MKKSFLLFLFIVFAGWLCAAETGLAQRMPIAVVNRLDIQIYSLALKGFKDALSRKGYIEGKNIQYDVYAFDNPDLFSLLKTKNYPLIYTIGSESTKVIGEKITNIPVIFSIVLKPAELNIKGMTGTAEGNVTGVSLDISIRQQLELLKLILPKIKTIGIIHNPRNSHAAIEEAKQLQTEFNVDVKAVRVNAATEVPKVLNEIEHTIDLLWLIPDVDVCTKDTLPFIINFSLNKKIPVMAFAESLVKAGALFGYVYDFEDIGLQAGELAVRIIQGESAAGDLAVSRPRRIGYVLNLKTAEYLGIKISPDVLRGAVAVY